MFAGRIACEGGNSRDELLGGEIQRLAACTHLGELCSRDRCLLVGANEAGKTTILKILGGKHMVDPNMVHVLEIEGLKRKLTSKLAPTASSIQPDWQIGECAGVWWRPNFETLLYPYCPPRITKPKECKKLFVVPLSERQYFAIPKNLKLLVVPLFELYDIVQRYGPVISAIPQQLSRFNFKE